MALVNSEISGPPMEHDLLVLFPTLCYIHFNMSSSFSLCILSTIFQATQAFPLHLAYAFAYSRLLRTTLARNVPHSWGACQGVKPTSRESTFQWINSCLFNVTLQLPWSSTSKFNPRATHLAHAVTCSLILAVPSVHDLFPSLSGPAYLQLGYTGI